MSLHCDWPHPGRCRRPGRGAVAARPHCPQQFVNLSGGFHRDGTKCVDDPPDSGGCKLHLGFKCTGFCHDFEHEVVRHAVSTRRNFGFPKIAAEPSIVEHRETPERTEQQVAGNVDREGFATDSDAHERQQGPHRGVVA